MREQVAHRGNGLLWAVTCACLGGAAALTWLNRPAAGVAALVSGFLFLVLIGTFATVGALIVANRPGIAVGWLFAALGLSFALVVLASEYAAYAVVTRPGALPAGPLMAWLGSWLGGGPGLAPLALVLLLFPNGRPPTPRWRWVARLVGLSLIVSLLASFAPGPVPNTDLTTPIANPLGIPGTGAVLEPLNAVGFGLLVLALLAAAASLVQRFRTARGVERQQLLWLVLAGVVVVAFLVAIPMLDAVAVENEAVEGALFVAAFVPLPIAVGIAILRHNLYAIDQLVNRTLVYGALTAAVVGLHLLAVGSIGALFRVEHDLGPALVATAVVAVLFQPLRERLQSGIDRLLYGERRDPYAILARLGRRLEETPLAGAVAPVVVETIARALKLPYAAIERAGGEPAVVAAHGASTNGLLRLPLTYQGEAVGTLLVAQRAPNEPLTAADRRVLGDLARLAAVAVHADGVATALQQSRERLVTAREEERRRLRNDLHDGLGPVLSGLLLRLETARNVFAHDPAVDRFLVETIGHTEDAVADIRRLVYALRPPALDDLGLVAALREAALHDAAAEPAGLRVTVQTREPLPALPAAVEVAAYRIVQEALTNVVRHAGARTCTVRLSVDDALCVEVVDDGRGIDPAAPTGVGLASMRGRAMELGGSFAVAAPPTGGTRVLAWLPCAAGQRARCIGPEQEPAAAAPLGPAAPALAPPGSRSPRG